MSGRSNSSLHQMLMEEESSGVLVPESSSLLDQLRTHGYRNLVQQRIAFPPDSLVRKVDDLMPTSLPDLNHHPLLHSASGGGRSPPSEESVRERIHRMSFYQVCLLLSLASTHPLLHPCSASTRIPCPLRSCSFVADPLTLLPSSSETFVWNKGSLLLS